RAALLDSMQPAYARVIAFAEGQLPQALDNPAGLGTTHPDGAAFYTPQLPDRTSTAMTAEQIPALGLTEAARLGAELARVQQQLGIEGSLDGSSRQVQADPKRLYPNTGAGRQAYIDDATARIDNIKRHLPAYFGLLPKADLVVRRVEACREQDGA